MAQTEMDPTGANPNQRPLSYGDLVRWLIIVALVALSIAAAFAIKETLLLFAIAFLIAMVLNPGVALLEQHGLKRGVAVVLLLIVLLAILALVVFLVIPPFFEQLQQLIEQLPGEWNRLYEQIQGWIKTYPALQQALPSRAGDILNTVTAQVGGIANFLLRSTLNLANGVLVALLCFLVVIFTLIEPEPITTAYLALVPPRYREPAYRSLARMMHQVERLGPRRRYQRHCNRCKYRRFTCSGRCATGVSIRGPGFPGRIPPYCRAGYSCHPCTLRGS
jgi:predicted PurR-regulated permease PerM